MWRALSLVGILLLGFRYIDVVRVTCLQDAVLHWPNVLSIRI